ncbi:MAG: 5-oxoprolinase subunit PxpB [Opitutae bacterium]|nr:5-oxoprolinase subunit PxpB [Opitutae bacterium]
MRITTLGDTALRIELGDQIDEPTHRRVQAALRALEAARLPAVSELTPAYATVTLFYDPVGAVGAGAPAAGVAGWLEARVREVLANPPKSGTTKGRTVEIPVCYGGDFGPDLGVVAAQADLSPGEVVKRHSRAEYFVHLVGFAPGFAYLGGLPKELATPRRATPRTMVPAGSLGIGGAQTGIYPLVTPGGWNLIGRTPRRMFRPRENPPTLLSAGDRVKFRAITREEFAAMEEGK